MSKNNEDEPVISVIIPVFNMERYLDRCLSSVVNQSRENLEILLINDGSTDKSSLICDNWQQKDDRIKVFHQSNSGVSTARNCGLINSTGEYLMFVDSDDYIDENALEELLQSIEKTHADFSTSNNRWFFEGGGEVKTEGSDHEILSREEFTKEMFPLRNQYAWGKLFSRRILKDKSDQYILFREDLCYSEDVEWLSRILINVEKIAWIPSQLYYYRRGRAESATNIMRSTYNETFIISSLKAYELALSTFQEAHLKRPIWYSYRRLVICIDAIELLKSSEKSTKRYRSEFLHEFFRGLRLASCIQEARQVLFYGKRFFKTVLKARNIKA